VTQLDLFPPPVKQCPYHAQRHMWKLCWKWDGPVVGEYISLEMGASPLFEQRGYLYMCRALVLDQIGPDRWVAIVDSPTTDNHGILVAPTTAEIWFDVYGWSRKNSFEPEDFGLTPAPRQGEEGKK